MFINQCMWIVILITLINQCKQQSTGTTWGGLLEESLSIYDEKCNHTTRNLATTFHKPVGGSKYIFSFWIRPTDNLKSNSRISFSTKEL